MASVTGLSDEGLGLVLGHIGHIGHIFSLLAVQDCVLRAESWKSGYMANIIGCCMVGIAGLMLGILVTFHHCVSSKMVRWKEACP